MKLFKNVDVMDLDSILKNGIISIDNGATNNWDSNKRANNSTSVVYLFKTVSEINTFVNYGCILLEVEVENAKQNEIGENDVNLGLYEEYIIDEVKPEQIVSIKAPRILKNYFNEFVSKENLEKIEWVEIEANVYEGNEKIEASDEVMNQWAKTIHSITTLGFNYFRGTNEDNTIIDLYDVKYGK